MTQSSGTVKGVWHFFLLAYAFSWLFWIPQAVIAHGIDLPSGLSRFLDSPLNPAAFGPLLAAILLTVLDAGWKGLAAWLKRGIAVRFNRGWLVAILVLPLLLYGGPVVLSSWLGLAHADFSVLANLPYAVIGYFVILLTAGPLQEEFGWRGYALPRLQARFDAFTSSAILGVFWWLWHLPLVFVPGRFMTDSLVLFAALLVEIVLTSILLTWIYNNTYGSVLAAMLFHTTMNWAMWVTLPGMKTNGPVIGLTIVVLTIAVILISRRPVRLVTPAK